MDSKFEERPQRVTRGRLPGNPKRYVTGRKGWDLAWETVLFLSELGFGGWILSTCNNCFPPKVVDALLILKKDEKGASLLTRLAK